MTRSWRLPTSPARSSAKTLHHLPLVRSRCYIPSFPPRLTCRKKKQQHRPSNLSAPSITSHVPPIVQEVLRSPGQPLDRETRVFVESRFGQDFSRVRLHTDGRATDSVRLVNALAYTVGHHIAVR